MQNIQTYSLIQRSFSFWLLFSNPIRMGNFTRGKKERIPPAVGLLPRTQGWGLEGEHCAEWPGVHPCLGRDTSVDKCQVASTLQNAIDCGSKKATSSHLWERLGHSDCRKEERCAGAVRKSAKAWKQLWRQNGDTARYEVPSYQHNSNKRDRAMDTHCVCLSGTHAPLPLVIAWLIFGKTPHFPS